MTTTSIDTAGGAKEAFGPFGHHRDAEGAPAVKRSGSAIVTRSGKRIETAIGIRYGQRFAPHANTG
jgi:hypothetical protein